MKREELLAESAADKFLRYVRIDTQSSLESKTRPSTPGQLRLAGLIRDELLAIGVADARVDEAGFVYATLPGNKPGAATIGFLAHLDTFFGLPGRDVRPILHRNYGGGEIRLPGGVVVTAQETPALARLIGHDLITADGRTLLGADDKAGVAEIMTLACRLQADPRRPRGTVKIAMTPDEETGRGVESFDVRGFGAHCAYTVDGGEAGEFELENFNADNVTVTIFGRNSHTGTARDQMVNAIAAAGALATAIPAAMRPETTDGRRGFLHVDGIEGDPERVTMRWLLRDFSPEGLAAKHRWLRACLRQLAAGHPGLRYRVSVTGGYRNMRPKIEEDPRIAAYAAEAIRRAGLEPVEKPIRGGTDGARLAFMGLPAPNLFTGGLNFHSRRELVSVQWMDKAVAVLLHLVDLWAGEEAS